MQREVSNDLMKQGLSAIANNIEQHYSIMDTGKYEYKNGELKKGDLNISRDQSYLEEISKIVEELINNSNITVTTMNNVDSKINEEREAL